MINNEKFEGHYTDKGPYYRTLLEDLKTLRLTVSDLSSEESLSNPVEHYAARCSEVAKVLEKFEGVITFWEIYSEDLDYLERQCRHEDAMDRDAKWDRNFRLAARGLALAKAKLMVNQEILWAVLFVLSANLESEAVQWFLPCLDEQVPIPPDIIQLFAKLGFADEQAVFKHLGFDVGSPEDYKYFSQFWF